jgi:outer membrane lipoprotein-sorting protein
MDVSGAGWCGDSNYARMMIMGLTTSHPAIRWAVPGAVVAIVLAAAGLTAVTADASPTLPPRSAAELLVDVQTASVATLSGTVVQTAELGLPDLPVQMGSRGSADFTSLVSGTHTLRVWYSGDDQQRLALLGTLGESDIVRNGSDVWTWSSADNSATHYQIPARPDGADADQQPPESALAMTPQQAADAALAAIDPTTSVTTDGTAEVADRAAYELVLAPKDTTSLIGEVRIAIDAEQHIPLRVRVIAKGASTPAFEVGFSQISFDAPGAEQFQFSPPPGATVTESGPAEDAPGQAAPQLAPDAAAPDTAGQDGPPTFVSDEPTVVGTGWTSIVVATLPPASAEPSPTPTDGSTPDGATPDSADPGRAAGGELQSVLGSLPQVSGDWGSGRLLQSTLFSVLITDDGRVLAGAVAPDALYLAAKK